MFCKYCGVNIDNDSLFCKECGNKQNQNRNDKICANPDLEHIVSNAEDIPTNADIEGYKINIDVPDIPINEDPQGFTINIDVPDIPINTDVKGFTFNKSTIFEEVKNTDPVKYCQICGRTLPSERTNPICSYCYQSPFPVGEPEQNRKGKNKPLVFICIAVIFIFLGYCYYYWSSSYKTVNSDNSSNSSNDTSSEVVLTEHEKAMEKACEHIFPSATYIIKNELKNPNTLSIKHDKSKFKADGAKISDFGTATYVNTNNKEVSLPYEICAIFTEEYYASLYLKIGDSVLYDYRNYVDDKGKITEQGASYYGLKKGSNYFKDEDGNIFIVPIESGITPDTSDSLNDAYITSSEYNKIEIGMTYDEVCGIIGSYGKELSRVSIKGYETVLIMWEGKGPVGANANVTFQNGKVMSKAQLLLE